MEHSTMSDYSSANILGTYLRSVSQYPLLSKDEEVVLTSLYKKTRDPIIGKKIVNSNLRLVVKIAKEMSPIKNSLMDVIQEGNTGLIKAVEKYDPDQKVPFANYAAYWIRAYIYRFNMNNSNLIKIGTTEAQRKLFYNLNKEISKLRNKGIELSDAELAEYFSVKEEEIQEMKIRMTKESSLDAPVGFDDQNSSRIDFVMSEGSGPDEAFEQAELCSNVREILVEFKKSLKPIEKDILEGRLAADESITLEEIGEKYSCTREWVRQVETKLKKKLKVFLNQVEV